MVTQPPHHLRNEESDCALRRNCYVGRSSRCLDSDPRSPREAKKGVKIELRLKVDIFQNPIEDPLR